MGGHISTSKWLREQKELYEGLTDQSLSDDEVKQFLTRPTFGWFQHAKASMKGAIYKTLADEETERLVTHISYSSIIPPNGCNLENSYCVGELAPGPELCLQRLFSKAFHGERKCSATQPDKSPQNDSYYVQGYYGMVEFDFECERRAGSDFGQLAHLVGWTPAKELYNVLGSQTIVRLQSRHKKIMDLRRFVQKSIEEQRDKKEKEMTVQASTGLELKEMD